MELDFSEQIKNLRILSAELQTRDDKPEMAMKNKSVCKICGENWGSCAHASDESNMMDEGPKQESKEGPMGDKEEMKSSENCEDCGKPESECECEDSEDEMEESDSAKKTKENKKGESKNEEKSGEKGKFPFDKFKKFDKSKASLPEKIAFMLQSKLQAHNEKFEQNLTFAQISKVYSRGLNVYKTNYIPTIKLHQWAIARVNLFLKMMSGGNVKNEYLLLDTDVANASSESFKESGLASYDFVDFSNLEFQLAKISLVEAGISENEMNTEISEAQEKKKINKTLNKPFRLPSGSKKKFGVYVKNDKGNVVMVKFGDPNMSIKRDDPERRKSYRARHGCDSPGPKWKANYWSCKMWSKTPVSKLASSENCGCGCGQCEETDVEDLVEIEGAEKGLWDNIREKKKRMGKNYKPAKPGSKDYPEKEAYKKAQAEEYDWDGEEEFNQEEFLLEDPSLAFVEETE
jgi:hypothetical protein